MRCRCSRRHRNEREQSPGCAKSADCAEIADLFRDLSKRTGKKFVIDPRVRAVGGVIGVDADKITCEQLSALATVNQFVAVPQSDLTLVIPARECAPGSDAGLVRHELQIP